MTELKTISALLTEAEVYRKQGLTEESLETYRKAHALLTRDAGLRKNTELVEAVSEKIQLVESELRELELDEEAPELPPEIQDLIARLFSFSKDQDVAAIEGAVALAEFGQYEKSLAEFQKVVSHGMRSNMDREMQRFSSQVNALIAHLRDSYKFIRDQSALISRYGQELSQSYRRIKEEQTLRDTLSRYVGQNLVKKILGSKKTAIFGTERKEVTILFADIRSFTSLSERLPAEEIVALLNQYFSTMVEIIFKHSGVLDKFVGDELMAVFGHLHAMPGNPCDDAVRAALEMQAALTEFMKLRGKQGKKTFEIGIGINTGSAVIGNVGSKNRMDYTVIGDCVNVAARFQQAAQGGEILIGETTYHKLGGDFRVEKKGRIRLKNKAKPILCYRVL
ncbi:MAG: adenylate/guanylate cyclase domain-containing protein [Deltaproteobacteria bacterium]|nr:adenylate/guanylate cyclase domain-containing protein [Deltaproteobacteria bacterium]